MNNVQILVPVLCLNGLLAACRPAAGPVVSAFPHPVDASHTASAETLGTVSGSGPGTLFSTQTVPSEWMTVPIMPGAFSGEEIAPGYQYLIRSTVAESQEYYLRELETRKWALLGASGDETLRRELQFVRSTDSLTIVLTADRSGLARVGIHPLFRSGY